MLATIIRRLLIMIPQLLLISLVAFTLAWLMPGDFVSVNMLEDTELTADQIQGQRDVLGLDDPFYQQYIRWLGSVIRGDFGMSMRHMRPVTSMISERMGNTFRLSLLSMIMAMGISIPLGIIAGRYSRKWQDKAITVYGFVGLALPNIVLGILFVWLFGITLQWLPFRGSINPLVVGTGFVPELLSRLNHLVLPVLSIAVGAGIGTIYLLKAQIIEGKASDYAMTANAKGVPEKIIFRKHILRNSLMPFAPGVGFIFAGLMGGTILIERIFAYPGMGELFLASVTGRDTNLAIGLVMFYAVISVVAILIGDIVVTIVDPRVRIK